MQTKNIECQPFLHIINLAEKENPQLGACGKLWGGGGVDLWQMAILGGCDQGWRSGERTRLPPMWLGFDSRTRRYMWVEFVVGSRPCSERIL